MSNNYATHLFKTVASFQRLRHATFSKLSQASNCFEKVGGYANIIVDE
ncbi:MAG: hypothetical protein II748_05620 [Clostridia bacterium]|nr:hypothetical protein [Clostridia bacterium]